jgi:DNA mismatch repair protein MutH
MTLTVYQTAAKLKVTNFAAFAKPGKNKGSRGQLIETALGIPNSSNLKDLVDGELKTFTVGESIAVTQVKHCLSEIIEEGVTFSESKVGEKLSQTIYVGFTRANDYVGTEVLNPETHPEHYQELAEDYAFICDAIRSAFERGIELDQLGFFSKGKPSHTITGPNKLLQIRTKASKTKRSDYVPLTFAGCTFNNKGMAFYLCGKFGKTVV